MENKDFLAIFGSETVVGAEKVLEFAIDDLVPGSISLTDAHMEFLAKYCPEESRDHFFKCLRVHYLQSSDSQRFSTGLECLEIMGAPPGDVIEKIKKHAEEQGQSLPEKDKEAVARLLRVDWDSLVSE